MKTVEKRNRLKRRSSNRHREWNLCQGQREPHDDDILDNVVAAFIGVAIFLAALAFVPIVAEILASIKGGV